MPTAIEDSIERVITGLLPETAWEGRWGDAATLDERMTFYKTPGVSIAVIDEYEVVWARGFGVREWGKPDVVRADTVFQAASISKPIFALAVMRLVEDGRLDLDEDINHYLTSWQVPANGSWQPRITLRQILSHSAGLTVHGFPGYLRSEAVPTIPQVLRGEAPANTSAVLVNIVPGTQTRYSGGGTTVGQQLLVDVLGMPFPEIMRALVLDPLQMNDSTYEQPLPAAWEDRAATAHPWQYQKVQGNWHIYPETAAAGLWTTAGDLAKAGLALQQIRRGEPGLLKKATLEAMLTPQMGDEIGIAFFLSGKDAGARFGHSGWDEGFVAEATFYRDGGRGAVVMINSNQGHPIRAEIMRAIAKAYNWPAYFDVEPASVAVAPTTLAGYAGRYRVREGFDCLVEVVGDALTFQPTGQPPLTLVPIADSRFRVDGLNTVVEFTTTGVDTVSGLRLLQQGQPIEASRVE